MKKKIQLIFIMVCLSLFVNAQKSVNGKVADKETGKPLEGATIFIPEYNKSIATDSLGGFSFSGLGNGIVKIQATDIGYKTIIQTIDLSQVAAVSISMERSETELEEVLITSNSTALPDKIPFPAISVSQNEIRKFNSPSVMGNLSYQPGIDRITIGNGIGKPVIRGLSFNRIMLYNQGTRIENQQWDDHHDLGLSDMGVENVEIVRGPAALIYGADAMGGALIFINEKPAAAGLTVGDANLGFDSNTLGLNADAGIKRTNNNGLFYGMRIGGQSQTSYLQGEGNEDVMQTGEKEEFAANSKFQNLAIKANVGISKKWGVSKLSYSLLNQQIGIIEDESKNTSSTGNDEAEQRDREMEAPYQEVATHILSSENTILTGKSKLNINLAYQSNDRKEYEPLPGKQKELAIGLKLNTTTYDVKWTSNADKAFGFTIGSQGTFLKNTNNGMEGLVPDADVKDIAGFGLFHYEHNKLNLLGGIRYDIRKIEAESYEKAGTMEEDTFILKNQGDTIRKPELDFSKNYYPVSFSLGAAYNLSEKFTIKINVATGFSAPNYGELGTFGKHEGTYRFERGDPNLKVEQNREGDIGLIWENEFISINVSGYYNNIKDYIFIRYGGDSIIRKTSELTDTLPLYNYQQFDATISGGEFSFDIHPERTRWLDLKITDAIIKGTLDGGGGGNLPYIPANKLIGELKLSRDKVWKFSDTYLSFVVSNYTKQKNVAAYELSTDGYTLVDVRTGAGFKLGKHKAGMDIFCTNLLNKGYFNQLSLVKYIGVRDMGRNIGVRLHVTFGE